MRKPSQLLAIFGMLIAVILAGCGANASTGYGSSNNAGSSNTPVASTATTATNSAATVKLAAVTVKGSAKMVLTNDKGLTLYYRTDDNATAPVCNGACLAAWPPLLSPGAAPTAPTGVTGTFTILSDSSRPQAEYNGHPLYTFASDAAAGDANGEGASNIWFVAAPTDLHAQVSSGSAPTATPTSGYSYSHA